MSTLVSYVLSVATTIVSLIVAMLLFASHLERREHTGLRVLAIAATAAAMTAVICLLLPETLPADPANAFSYPMQFVLFSALLAILTAVVAFLFDASVWTALFCSTAGYVVQNFASGLSELMLVLTGIREGLAGDTLETRLIGMVISVCCYAVVYIPFYLAFARHISQESLEQIDDRRMLAIMTVVMLGVIGFDLVIKSLTAEGLATVYVVLLRASHLLTCALTYALDYELLVSRHLEIERAATERVMAERELQYQRSRENVEAINIKCHDIRHQIRHLAGGSEAVDSGALADIEREVSIYDAQAQTGNEALDTVLTEKGLVCSGAGITLSCMADGESLGFMAPADIYAFFGNALDNAIRAVSGLERSRRSISLVVREARGMVSIHIENPCEGELEFVDGLPETTKQDKASHGFGVRSMRNTAERYGGTLTTLVQDGSFHVNAMIPAQ